MIQRFCDNWYSVRQSYTDTSRYLSVFTEEYKMHTLHMWIKMFCLSHWCCKSQSGSRLLTWKWLAQILTNLNLKIFFSFFLFFTLSDIIVPSTYFSANLFPLQLLTFMSLCHSKKTWSSDAGEFSIKIGNMFVCWKYVSSAMLF